MSDSDLLAEVNAECGGCSYSEFIRVLMSLELDGLILVTSTKRAKNIELVKE